MTAGDPLPPSTISEMLGGKRLPRLPSIEFVESYAAACLSASGRDEPAVAACVARWRELWRSLATPEKLEEPAEAARADRPALHRQLILLSVVVVVFLAGPSVAVTLRG